MKPLFDLAGVKCDVVVTERANHARDLLQTIDFERPERIDGVVGVGGDGMFSELVRTPCTLESKSHSLRGCVNAAANMSFTQPH